MTGATSPEVASNLPAWLDTLLSNAAVPLWLALLAFLLKLLGDHITEKTRQATNVRVLAAYIDLAIESYNDQKFGKVPGKEGKFQPASYCDIKNKTEKCPETHSAGDEKFTPFIPFTSQGDLAIDDVRDLIGFLDNREIATVVRFVELEALTHAIAKDLRSEYVRQAWTQKRKFQLYEQLNETIVKTRCAAESACGALAPYKERAAYFWYTPWGRRWQKRRYIEKNQTLFGKCKRKMPGGTRLCRCFPQNNNPG